MRVFRTLLLLLALVATPAEARLENDQLSDTAVMAAFLYRFVKFVEWPPLASAEPITFCIIGDAPLANAVTQTVRGQQVDGHPFRVEAVGGDESLRSCQVIFLSKTDAGRADTVMDGLHRVPVLTVSDGKDFARSNGIIEFFVNDGRVRFAINIDAANRAGLRLSSKLLGLARIVRDQVP